MDRGSAHRNTNNLTTRLPPTPPTPTPTPSPAAAAADAEADSNCDCLTAFWREATLATNSSFAAMIWSPIRSPAVFAAQRPCGSILKLDDRVGVRGERGKGRFGRGS